MPVNLSDWPFSQPDHEQAIMMQALADCTTPAQVRSVLSAFLVGDLVLGLVQVSPEQRAKWGRPARPRRRWWHW